MKDRDEIVGRLLKAARIPDLRIEMPFGFDTRVLAAVRETRPSGSVVLASLARGAAMVALVVIALATAGVYRESSSDTDATNEYAIADSAIQNHLGE